MPSLPLETSVTGVSVGLGTVLSSMLFPIPRWQNVPCDVLSRNERVGTVRRTHGIQSLFL
jgi:hypothetical protein